MSEIVLRRFVKYNPEYKNINGELYCTICQFLFTDSYTKICIGTPSHKTFQKIEHATKIMDELGYKFIRIKKRSMDHVQCSKGHIWRSNLEKFLNIHNADKCKCCIAFEKNKN